MNKYFIQLFLKENTVILPGFGALTAPNGNVEEIMFLPYLKTDDGKLANYIAETEGIDPQDAQNTIAKFIREMEVNLNKGESFDIFQFGSFSKNEMGEIEFQSWLKEKPQEKEADIVPETITEENNPEEVIESDTTKEVEPITFIPEDISEEIKEKTETILEKETDVSALKPKENESVVFVASAPKETIAEEKKKKRGAPFLILTLLVLGLIFSGIYFFSRGNKSSDSKVKVAQNEKSESKEKKVETPKEVVQEKDTVTTEPAEEKLPNPEVIEDVVQENIKGFFLINGVYSSESVAKSKVDAAKKDGLDAKILPKGNGKMYISLADFTDRNEANKMLKNLREKGFKVWVLQK